MIIKFNDIEKKINILKKDKRSIVLCHGTFDLFHYGHLQHLKEAKKFGDILVVSITSDKFLKKNPKSPVFNEQQRAKILDALSIIDFVTITPYPNAVEIIKAVKPSIYCKGKEYHSSDKHYNKNILNDIKYIKKYKGKIKFIGKNYFSSTKLISDNFSDKNFSFKEKNFSHIEDVLNRISKLKILVIGELIIDNYIFCNLNGLTAKNSAISSSFEKEEFYFGGAGAVYKHLSNFNNNVTLLSAAGTEEYAKKMIKQNTNKDCKIFTHKNNKTIKKIKYINNQKYDQEVEKLFAINNIDKENKNNSSIDKKVYKFLDKNLKKYDLVLLLDYGHGFFTKELIHLIQKKSKNLSVNCQSNSSNYGMNILNKKYTKVNSFVLDQKEIDLCFSKYINSDYEKFIKDLKNQLQADNAWLTIGPNFSIGIDKKNNLYKIPALNEKVVDTIGAGDAFFSMSSVLSCIKCDIETSTFVSQVAGSINVKSLSNKSPLNKEELLNNIKYYLG